MLFSCDLKIRRLILYHSEIVEKVDKRVREVEETLMLICFYNFNFNHFPNIYL